VIVGARRGRTHGEQAMELILWRHAEAEDAGGGATRSQSTKRGRKQAPEDGRVLKPRSRRLACPGEPAQRALRPSSRSIARSR